MDIFSAQVQIAVNAELDVFTPIALLGFALSLQNVGRCYPSPLACKPCLCPHDGARYVASPTWRTGCWRSVASTQAQIALVDAGGIFPIARSDFNCPAHHIRRGLRSV